MRNRTNMIGMITVAAMAFVATPALAQCGGGGYAKQTSDTQGDIVDTAVAAGKFNTLVAAVKAAGLVDALKSDGPLTVFAPTDEAFAKLPAGTVENLLKPENRAQLQAILKYHVVAGKLMAGDVVRASGATTLEGQRIDFKAKDGKVMVDGARVVKTDIKTSNGVIHVIDQVILPSSKNIVETAQSAKSFNTLLTAATKAGLADTLANGGPFTVFAPTDEAFAKLPDGTIENLLKPENRAQLANILKYHVIPGRVYSTDAVKAGQAKTLTDQRVTIRTSGSGARVNDANIVTTDLDASNGVIHVIDKVILPDA
jgi:transforming growth factor-beta-induced protein